MHSIGLLISLLFLTRQLVDSQGPNDSDLSAYIVNGQQAIQGQFPYQALVLSPNSLCGGSLISNQYVLTAAHCITGSGSVNVVLGSIKFQNFIGNEVFVESSSIYKHPGWNPRLMIHDIAIIRLAQNVTFNEYIQPIRLMRFRDGYIQKWERKPAIISGWGRTEVTSGTSTNEDLMWASVQVLSVWECRSILLSAWVSPATAICTSTAQSATCMGDSGGPMVVIEDDGLPTLVGVTSYLLYGPNRDCRTATVNVFTFTGKEVSWIAKITGLKRI